MTDRGAPNEVYRKEAMSASETLLLWYKLTPSCEGWAVNANIVSLLYLRVESQVNIIF